VASRGCGANRCRGRSGIPPPALVACEQVADGSGLSLPEAASSVPGRKSPWWSAERGPVRYGTGRAARLGGRASHARQNKKSALSALHPPLVRGGGADKVPKGRNNPDARMRRGNEKGHGERRNRRIEQVARAYPFAGRVGLFDIVDSVRAALGNIRLAIRYSPLWPDRSLLRGDQGTAAPFPLSAAGSSTGRSARARCGAGRRTRRSRRPRRSRRDP